MFKFNENGRSMVEMLGVLAIAAILTIGGVTGYLAAMKKTQSNDIAELVAIVSIYAQSHTKNVSNLNEVGKKMQRYPCLTSITGRTDGRVIVEFDTTVTCNQVRSLTAGLWGNSWNNSTNTYTPVSEF